MAIATTTLFFCLTLASIQGHSGMADYTFFFEWLIVDYVKEMPTRISCKYVGYVSFEHNASLVIVFTSVIITILIIIITIIIVSLEMWFSDRWVVVRQMEEAALDAGQIHKMLSSAVSSHLQQEKNKRQTRILLVAPGWVFPSLASYLTMWWRHSPYTVFT